MKEYVFMRKKDEEQALEEKRDAMRRERKREIVRSLNQINAPNFDSDEQLESTKAITKRLIEEYNGFIKIDKKPIIHESLKPKTEKAFTVYKYRMTENIRF